MSWLQSNKIIVAGRFKKEVYSDSLPDDITQLLCLPVPNIGDVYTVIYNDGWYKTSVNQNCVRGTTIAISPMLDNDDKNIRIVNLADVKYLQDE